MVQDVLRVVYYTAYVAVGVPRVIIGSLYDFARHGHDPTKSIPTFDARGGMNVGSKWLRVSTDVLRHRHLSYKYRFHLRRWLKRARQMQDWRYEHYDPDMEDVRSVLPEWHWDRWEWD